MPVGKPASLIVALLVLAALLAVAFSVFRGPKDGEKPALASAAPDRPYLVYQGASDASAAVALDDVSFALADDEDNRLRIFRADSPGPPIASLELGEFLEPEPVELEADIEGAARVDNRIYWLSSHDTNKRGEIEPGRDYFFATDVSRNGDTWKLTPAGTPSRALLTSLLASPAFQELLQASGPTTSKAGKGNKKGQKPAGPIAGPVKLEGLCASPDGKRLFLGFRQPRILGHQDRVGRAVVVPLENPREVVEQQATPVFGEPQIWNLGGLVIRSMEYSPAHRAIFIIAGPEKKGFSFVLYRWNAQPRSQPFEVDPLVPGDHQLTPEALVAFPAGRLFVICDDGDVAVDPPAGQPPGFGTAKAIRNKDLPDPSLKRFRAFWFTLNDTLASVESRGVAPEK